MCLEFRAVSFIHILFFEGFLASRDSGNVLPRDESETPLQFILTDFFLPLIDYWFYTIICHILFVSFKLHKLVDRV